MSTETQLLTYKAYLALPETKQRCHVVDGVLVIEPPPTLTHQWMIGEIGVRLSNFVKERELGVVMMAPLDVLVRKEPLRVRQPDVLYLSAERTGIRGLAELRGMALLEIPPDLVVEVLSPSDTRRDIEDKVADYRRIGVQECWLVSPEAETVEVLRLSTPEDILPRIVGIGGTLSSELLGGFTLRLKDIFR